jgi:plasmid stabilization system protein ParE
MVIVRISERADKALLNAIGYISQDNPTAAVNLIIDLQKRVVQTLSVFPDAGVTWNGDRRLLTIRRYTFIYRHDAAKGEVVVLDLFGPGMDWR